MPKASLKASDVSYKKDMQEDFLRYGNALADNHSFNSIKDVFLSLFNNFSLKNELLKIKSRIGLWIPVFYGVGAYCGFEIWNKINFIPLLIIAFSLLIIGYILKHNYFISQIFRFVFVFIFGVAIAIIRIDIIDTKTINAPVKITNLEGIISDYDRSFNEKQRVVIKLNNLNNLPRSELPQKIRLNLTSEKDFKIGDKIVCYKGMLFPPSGEFIPGGFNNARKLWFKNIGATGNCNSVFIVKNKHFIGNFDNYLTKLRKQTSLYLSEGKIGGGKGLLAALITGDRSYISPDDTNAMQISGLGHVISISGLHVAVVGGMAYFIIVKLLSLSEAIALRIDIRKIATGVSIFTTLIYVVFAGYEAPAVRAFLMSLIFLGAIIFERKSINMRGLALAALFIITITPESVYDIGFMMSFIATMALIALWERFNIRKFYSQSHFISKFMIWLLGAFAVSLVAGLATAPLVLNGFGRFNQYSILSNLLAAPINDFIIGPFALIGSLFSLIGLGKPFFVVAAWGCDTILYIAKFVTKLPMADVIFQRMDVLATIIIVTSICWLCLFNSKISLLGVIGLVGGIIIWLIQPQIIAYIATNGIVISAVEKDYYGKYRSCYAKGGRFYALQMVNYMPIPLKEREAEEQLIKSKYVNYCAVGGGDWQAHYVKLKGDKRDLLSLTFDGKTYPFSQENAPSGAVLMKRGWKLSLYMPTKKNTPWQ